MKSQEWSYKGYQIYSHSIPSYPGQVFYSAIDPLHRAAFSNTDSLEKIKAKIDTDVLPAIKHTGEYMTATYKGESLRLHDPGGLYDVESIDPGVRELVLELNSMGLATEASCSGHPRSPQGFIGFVGALSAEETKLAKDTIRQYGFRSVRAATTTKKYGHPRTEITIVRR